MRQTPQDLGSAFAVLELEVEMAIRTLSHVPATGNAEVDVRVQLTLDKLQRSLERAYTADFPSGAKLARNLSNDPTAPAIVVTADPFKPKDYTAAAEGNRIYHELND